MALESVQVYVKSDALVPAPVNGVIVQVWDATGATLITSGTTGAVDPGKAYFTLDGNTPPVQYRLRFFISGGSMVSPQLIDIYSPPAGSPTGTNNFEAVATLFTLPVAVDPRLCRCSGYVRGPDGRPRKGVDIHFIPMFNPLVVEDKAVLGERVAIRTDAEGYVSVDLYRYGIYMATVESHDNVEREIVVPDRSSVNIAHLLFPIVVSVVWDPVGPWNVSIGATLDVTPEVKSTDFRTLDGTANEDVLYATDDPSVASVLVGEDTLTIHGNASGSTVLRATRRDTSIVYIPDPGIDGDAVTINVS